MTLTLGGNATFLLEIAGLLVLADPWLTPTLGPLRRLQPCGISPALAATADMLLVSHAHPDHLHPPSLGFLPSALPCLAPRGAPEQRLRALGFRDVTPLDPWDEHHAGEIHVTAVPSIHCRGSLGFVLRGPAPGESAYYAGDAGPRTPFAAIARRSRPLHAALLPVGGSSLAWGPLQRHLTPGTAARAAAVLQPAVAVPLHWGHVPCVPPFLDRFRGTASAFQEALGILAPQVIVLAPPIGTPVPL